MNEKWWKRAIRFVKDYDSVIILVLGLVFYFILLIMCIFQMHRSSNLTTRNLALDTVPQKIHISLQVEDSLVSADPEMMAKIDSAIKAINVWNEYRDEKFLNGLNDLRQETNNVINKQNGWLSFWVAILALVGALFPLTFQLRTEHKLDTEMKEIAKKRNELEHSMLFSDISKLSFTLMSCGADREIINSIDRNALFNDFFDDICVKTGTFLNSLKTDKRLNIAGKRAYLMMVLCQLHSVYSVCVPLTFNQYKMRRLSKLIQSLGVIIGNLSQNNMNIGEQNLNNALDQVLTQMEQFRM